jgi:alanine-glyoxylate transaminase/serine-glyoxylate transaminase/serine-pyruvate transaminase
MPGRRHLFVPGPTNIPDRVLRAMHRASEDHRSASFPNFVRPLLSSVRELFDTNGSVALFPATGTGGWEAALTNTLPVGATVLQTGAGHFADQWSDSAGRLGYGVLKSPDREWGKAPDPTEIEDTLKADTAHQIEAVLVVHNETSTGVTADLPAVRRALDSAGHPALLLSDGVSAVGSLPYHHDAWGVDVALTGSQKGLMLPAGLTMLALSEKALSKLSSVDTPRAYFDLRPMLEQNAAGYFPYTPPLPLLYGLREALDILGEEGIEAVWARHHRLADGVRAAVEEWGLKRCCEDWRDASNTVTTVMLPQSLDGEALIRHAHEKYSLDLGGGLGPLAGKAFRVGHIGDLNEGMILGALGLIELCLSDLGFRVPFGSGAAAALRSWSEVE